MALDLSTQRRFRLISGTIEQVEDALNALWEDYVFQPFVYSVIGDKLIVTVPMISMQEAEKAAMRVKLAQVGAPWPKQ